MDSKTPSIPQIQSWLIAKLSQTLEIESEKIDISASFDSYGLDSAAAVTLTGDIQEWLKCEVDPMLFFDYPTVEQLADHLAETQEILS